MSSDIRDISFSTCVDETKLLTFLTMAKSLYEVRVEDLVVRIERLGPLGRT
jgi:hypothetical protein